MYNVSQAFNVNRTFVKLSLNFRMMSVKICYTFSRSDVLTFHAILYIMRNVSIDLTTSIARVMMAADFTMKNISVPLLTSNATVDDVLAYNSTRDPVNLELK